MAVQFYQDKNFTAGVLRLIDELNHIIRSYQQQGYTLTVRQLYYQLVARAVIENTEQSYKRITRIVNDARLAGLMDWDAIEDRTREFVSQQRWESPQAIMRAAESTYHMDMWDNQQNRVFVIVEKEALVGILARSCRRYDVPLLAARGYPSGTVLREFAVELVMPALANGQDVTILHLGDHDPSGIDMTRDLEQRIELFSEYDQFDGVLELRRIALSMAQIDDQRPPPNPAKSTDSRYKDYRRLYGNTSWELDALSPSFLNNLLEDEIAMMIDDDKWEQRRKWVEFGRAELTRVRDLLKFDEDAEMPEGFGEDEDEDI